MNRWHKSSIALAVLVALLVGLRIALPGIVRDEINQRGGDLGDYRAHVEDVDLHLWRGAYSIHDMVIEKKTGKVPVPLAKIPTIDLSVSWNALFHGGVVAKVNFIEPVFSLVDGSGSADSQSGEGVDWRGKLEELLPIRLDEVRISNGTVHFRNFIAKPQVDLSATAVDASVDNLTNVRDDRGTRAARLTATANILNGAPMEAEARFDPFADFREFGFDLRVKKIKLTELNDFFRAYAFLDVESGDGDLIVQMEAKDGKVTGYAKPLFRDIKLIDWKEDIKNPLRLAWEALAGTMVAIFKNHPQDQFATRIEFEGSVDNPKVDTWESIKGILRNAFVKALGPEFEQITTD